MSKLMYELLADIVVFFVQIKEQFFDLCVQHLLSNAFVEYLAHRYVVVAMTTQLVVLFKPRYLQLSAGYH